MIWNEAGSRPRIIVAMVDPSCYLSETLVIYAGDHEEVGGRHAAIMPKECGDGFSNKRIACLAPGHFRSDTVPQMQGSWICMKMYFFWLIYL